MCFICKQVEVDLNTERNNQFQKRKIIHICKPNDTAHIFDSQPVLWSVNKNKVNKELIKSSCHGPMKLFNSRDYNAIRAQVTYLLCYTIDTSKYSTFGHLGQNFSKTL